MNGIESLSEHVGIIAGLLGICASGVLFLFWRILTSDEKRIDKLEENLGKHKEQFRCERSKCREEILRFFASKQELKELDKEVWDAINSIRRGDWNNKNRGM